MTRNSNADLSIGELARLAGVSTDSVRHYERKGVIAAATRGANGYRRFPRSTVPRLHLVRRALAVGFTLDELARVLGKRDRGGAPCAEVRKLAADKLADVEGRLADLLALRDELRATLRAWDVRLEKTRQGKPARLLETLPPSHAAPAERAAPFSTNHRPRKKTNR